MFFRKSSVGFIVMLVLTSALSAQTVWYVDDDASGANDGTSWTDAFVELQSALAVAASGDEIRVAQGIYKPDYNVNTGMRTGNRTMSFQLVNGVAIKGGYAGVGSADPDARDFTVYETVLSGDLNGDDVYDLAGGLECFTISGVVAASECSVFDLDQDGDVDGTDLGHNDNSRHVVTSHGVDSATILDGFTITAGKGDYTYGAGMRNDYSSPRVTNCIFKANYDGGEGGAVYNLGASPIISDCIFIANRCGYNRGGAISNRNNSNPLIQRCVFDSNWANAGGAIYNYQSSPVVVDCVFRANKCTWSWGGAMWNVDNSHPDIVNCVFIGNRSNSGGAIENATGCSPRITNCTLFANVSSNLGGGIYNDLECRPVITNCILWANVDRAGTTESAQVRGRTMIIRNSCIQGLSAFAGNSNIGDDPLFIDAYGPDGIAGTEDDNLQLSLHSPCIDAGDNAAVPEGIMTDLAGNPRFIDEPNTPNTGIGLPPIVDMGAYEYDPSNYPPRNSFVNIHAVGANDGTSWADAYNHLQDAFAEAASSPVEIYAIWVAAGTYRPDEGADQIPGNRQASFTLLDGVAVYGGFAGNETALDQRDPAANVTILSGDIGVPGDNSDNSLHVVIGSGTDATAVLDGFTITAGNANGSVAPHNSGGGLYISSGSPTINNCIFIANATIGNGAGLYLYSSSPKIANTSFLNNTSLYYGGAIYNRYYSSLTLINCLLASNTAKLGAAVSSSAGSSATLLNCTISQNTATTTYGGIQNAVSCQLIAANCVFWGNSDPTGTGQSAQIYGGTQTVNYSCIQDDVPGGGVVFPGMGNIDADPLMVLGTYTLTAGSPAIDAGDNAAVPEDTYTDLTGSLRILDGTGDGLPVVDMGAFEYVFEPGPAFTLLAAVSRKVHGQAGVFDIDLPLDSAAAELEPRAGGPTMIVLAFSDDLDPAVSCANVVLSSGVCEGVTVVENEMAMALSDVTGNTCLSLALGGIVSATGVPLSGAAEVRIRVLLGKVDNDESGMVTISDLSAIKSQLFQPVTADTFRCDVHSDAVIDIRDLSATKSNLFGSVSCP